MRLEQETKTQHVAIASLALNSICHVAHMGVNGLLEQGSLLSSRDMWVLHGFNPSNRFGTNSAASFGTAMLELANLSGLVGWAGHTVHLEVSKLDDHLDVSVRRALEFLDQALAISFIFQNVEGMLADQLFKVLLRGLDRLVDSSVECKVEFLRSLQIGGDSKRTMIDLVLSQIGTDIVVQATCWGAVHDRVLCCDHFLW